MLLAVNKRGSGHAANANSRPRASVWELRGLLAPERRALLIQAAAASALLPATNIVPDPSGTPQQQPSVWASILALQTDLLQDLQVGIACARLLLASGVM